MQDLKDGRIELVKKLKQKDKTLKNFEKQLDHYPDLHRLKDFPKMKDRVAAIHKNTIDRLPDLSKYFPIESIGTKAKGTQTPPKNQLPPRNLLLPRATSSLHGPILEKAATRYRQIDDQQRKLLRRHLEE
jgi:hypothetical protein